MGEGRAGGGETRRRLLESAEAIVLREGPDRLTLDAVAREAGVSKGGVLYHFGTKDALIAAMVARLYEEWDEDIERALAASADAPGRWTRAYVLATCAPWEESTEPTPEAGAGLLAAIANDPALLDPLRERFRAWQASLEADGIDPATATVARLAVDGLLIADVLGLAPPSGELRERVIARLLDLAADRR